MLEQQQQAASPVSIFYSYAHEDETLRNELEKHLSLLQRHGIITTWYDRQIAPGTDWAQAVDDHLNEADIILLLISPDFFASDYRYGVEMQRAMIRQRNGEAYVIPVLLRPVDWHGAPFEDLLCLPRDGKAVTEWSNQDAAFRDIATGIRGAVEYTRGAAGTKPLSPLPSWAVKKQVSPVSRQNRDRLLKRVRTFWIKGVLEQSLHQGVLISLGLQEQPDAVENPWRLIMQESEQPARPLPAGTHITQVYDDTDGELLILGEPGAGKTTLLLKLARDLLDRAEHDESHQIPVILNLSSWARAKKRQTLADWIVEELYTRYQLPRKIGQTWVNAELVILLLDGLDEVAQEHRSECVKTINTYRLAHDLVPVVICSRNVEYLAQTSRVLLHSAVVVQPLTAQQIDAYFASAHGQLEAVRAVLHEDPELREMATTPLMLSILTLTYQGKSVNDLQIRGSPEVQRRQVLEQYVERMLHRRGTKTSYTTQQTKRWLAWLARRLMAQRDKTFSVDRMHAEDMSWLSSPKLYFLHHQIIALLNGVVYGVVSGVVTTLVFGLIPGLIGAVAFGLLSWFISNAEINMQDEQDPDLAIMLVVGIAGPVLGFVIGLGIGLAAWLVTGYVYKLGIGLIYGLGIGLIYGLINGWLRSTMRFRIVRTHIFIEVITLLVAILISILVGVQISKLVSTYIHVDALIKGLIGVFTGALAVVLIIGLLGQIYRLGKLGGGLLYGIALGLLGGLGGGPMIALVGALVGTLRGGWYEFFEHSVLQLLLWHSRAAPFRYPRFLDYASELILLRKIGRDYIFIHQMLLDYFASLDALTTNHDLTNDKHNTP